LLAAVAARAQPPSRQPATPVERDDEPRLRAVRQLTSGGQNAEAYWNREGTALVFQSTRGELECDQIFRMAADGSGQRQVSVGGGRTTCGYFQIDGSILYSSTHAHGPGCLASPDRSQGYTWPLHPEMDIWRADADGRNARVLFASAGYDAEATVCHRDGRIVFTSTMNGDLDLYAMDRDGGNLVQLTNTPGYDGGAFFSPDCSKIVWRASRPRGEALSDYRALLRRNLVRPSRLEIFVADADGSNAVQVTRNGAANFAPYMHPDNQRILYASNRADPSGRDFDLYLIRSDGTGEERITRNPTFDGFPMWSHDGRRLVFASNRGNERPGETNVFVADWVEAPDQSPAR
jgi:Tol biopolymer transport system component